MKYIIFEVGENKRKIPFMFPVDLTHRAISEALLPILWRNYVTAAVSSAGDFNPKSGRCSGLSESLNVMSNPDDSQVIEMYDFTHGII